MATGVCSGLTVLEFGTGKVNALVGMILAEAGARVVKVEPPGGDPLRQELPTAFLVWNRGKESVVLDLHTAQGRGEAQRLAGSADIVVEAFADETARRFGISYEAFNQGNARLVYCAIKGFGADTGYSHLKGYEAIVAAKAGYYTPAPYRPGPLYSNFAESTLGAAHQALQGILSALIVRERTGLGQKVEATLLQGLFPYDLSGMINWHLNNRRPDLKDAKAVSAMPSLVSERLPTRDGRWVEFMSIMPHQFRAYIHALGMDHLWDDPAFKTAPFFPEEAVKERFRDLLFARFRERTLPEWLEDLNGESDVVFEVVASIEESLDHPQARHNRASIEIDDPRVGRMRQVGPLADFALTPAVVGVPAPALDAHGDLGGRAEIGRRNGKGDPVAIEAPLAGVTVLELANFYATPYALTLLAALGARVIKIEDLAGDPWRGMIGGIAAVQAMEGKESIALNLREPEGREIVKKLVERAHVFINAFRPGVETKLGVDYDALKKVNPSLIYLNAAGYGSSGPYASRPMYGNTTKAMMGGLYRQAGRWLDPSLAKGRDIRALKDLSLRFSTAGPAGGDPEAALARATTLLIAILEQRRTGRGQFIDTSMVNLNGYANADDFNSYPGKPPFQLPDVDGYGLGPLYRLYPAAAGWVFLACPRQDEWEAFCKIAGLEALAGDLRFRDAAGRTKHDEELIEALSARFATRTAKEWEALFVPNGVGCVEVNEGGFSNFICTDPGIAAAGLVAEVQDVRYGPYLRHGPPVRFSVSPTRIAGGCQAGQNTAEILAELGYPPDEITKLADGQVVGVWKETAAASH